jgi:putative NADH-flavin reductase
MPILWRNDMKIAIIGASRGIGYQLLKIALEEGHEVTVLLRNPSKLQITDNNLHVIKGDILDPSNVATVTAGQNGICVCIGIPPTLKPVEVFSKGIKKVLTSIKDNPEQKLIVITGIGAGDSKGHGGFLYDRVVNPLLLKKIYLDKDREEALIKESNANWLIVQPGFLTNGPRTGKYRIIDNLTGITAGKISRSDVADFMLKQLMEPTHFGKTPLLTY